MFLRKNWRLPVSVFTIATAVVCVYLLQTDTPKAPIKTYKAVEAAPKPPPQGETAESGHWHGNEWHSQPHDTHAPAEVVSEVPPPPAERPEVQSAPVGAQRVNAQSDVLEQEAYKFTQEERDFQRALKEWGDRLSELSDESSRAGRAHTALLPGTEEELERYKADPEWQRKLNEALAEAAKSSAMVDAHMKEMPVRP